MFATMVLSHSQSDVFCRLFGGIERRCGRASIEKDDSKEWQPDHGRHVDGVGWRFHHPILASQPRLINLSERPFPMSDFVQRLDKRTGEYIKIEVRSGRVIGDPQKRKFPDADEIEPIEIELRRASQPDPLAGFR